MTLGGPAEEEANRNGKRSVKGLDGYAFDKPELLRGDGTTTMTMLMV